MSMWTHIAAVIDVDTCIESDDIENDVRELLKTAPKITGSEGPADIFVNVLPGYNASTNADCRRCKYGSTIKRLPNKGGFTCDASEDYECPSGEYQTRVVITVVGDLRDRFRKDTKDEWLKFKKFIDKTISGRGFIIRNYSWKIIGY